MLELVLTRPGRAKRASSRRRRGLRVPRPRRAAHLPRPPGRRRRPAGPPRPRGLPGADDLQCIGTSATMSTEGTLRGPARRSSPVSRPRLFGTRSAPSTSSARPWSGPPARRPRPCRPSGSRRPPRPRRATTTSRTTRWPAGSRPRFGLASRTSDGPAGPPAADARSRPRRASWHEHVRASTRNCARGDPRHPARPARRHATRQRTAAVRLPAAPVPVQGRHRLRHPRARGHPPPHRHLPGRAARTAGGSRCSRWASAASAARST